MPTTPFGLLLNRTDALSRAQPLIDIVSPVLQETINYSTHALVRCERHMSSSGHDRDVHIAPLVLFRRSIELTDAIEVLLAQACVEPAFPLLRSSLEATLSLLYIFETDDLTDERMRALAWLYRDVHDRLRHYNTIRERKISDDLSQAISDAIVAAAEKEHRKLQAYLKKPHMQPVIAEHRAQKKQKNNPPRWYSLFDGPNNLRCLAARVAWLDYYDLLYRSWSRDAHSSGNVEKVLTLTQGRQTVEPLRAPGNMFQIAAFAQVFLTHAMLKMTRRYRPDEEEHRMTWYRTEVAPAMERIQNTSIDIDAQVSEQW